MNRPGFATRRAAHADRWALVVADAGKVKDAGPLFVRNLARAVAGLAGKTFPLEDASAERLADGFLLHVQGLQIAGTDERRALIAPLVAAEAAALDVLIHEARQRLAERHWTARTGVGGGG